MELLTFIQQLIERFGLLAALMAFAGFNYVLIARRSRKAEDDQKSAFTAQQEAITEQFSALSAERRSLQTQLDAVRGELAALRAKLEESDDERARLADELAATRRTAESAQAAQKASDERAASLTRDMENLRVKVMTLETERAVRVDELKRETERAMKLEREVTDLRARVAKLEGENSALKQVLDKLNVVSVKPPPPDPDPPPNAPPPVALHVEPKASKENAA